VCTLGVMGGYVGVYMLGFAATVFGCVVAVPAIVCSFFRRAAPWAVLLGLLSLGATLIAMGLLLLASRSSAELVRGVQANPEVPAIQLLSLALAAFAVFRGCRRLPREEYPPGCCPQCGYELRPTRQLGIEGCPECGHGWVEKKSLSDVAHPREKEQRG